VPSEYPCTVATQAVRQLLLRAFLSSSCSEMSALRTQMGTMSEAQVATFYSLACWVDHLRLAIADMQQIIWHRQGELYRNPLARGKVPSAGVRGRAPEGSAQLLKNAGTKRTAELFCSDNLLAS
jgi:hypothetical protein